MPLATPRPAPIAAQRPKSGPEPSIELGDLIAVAYEEARELTDDDGEAMRLATLAISELLASTHNDRAIRDLAAMAND